MTRSSRLFVVLASAITIIALTAWLWLQPTKTAELSYGDRVFHLPLPTWSTRLGADEGSARYLGVGDPEFGDALGEFEYVEQLGSAHLLVSGDLRLLMNTSKRSRWFTEIHLRIE